MNTVLCWRLGSAKVPPLCVYFFLEQTAILPLKPGAYAVLLNCVSVFATPFRTEGRVAVKSLFRREPGLLIAVC